jgi:hypothetical protein
MFGIAPVIPPAGIALGYPPDESVAVIEIGSAGEISEALCSSS